MNTIKVEIDSNKLDVEGSIRGKPWKETFDVGINKKLPLGEGLIDNLVNIKRNHGSYQARIKMKKGNKILVSGNFASDIFINENDAEIFTNLINPGDKCLIESRKIDKIRRIRKEIKNCLFVLTTTALTTTALLILSYKSLYKSQYKFPYKSTNIATSIATNIDNEKDIKKNYPVTKSRESSLREDRIRKETEKEIEKEIEEKWKIFGLLEDSINKKSLEMNKRYNRYLIMNLASRRLYLFDESYSKEIPKFVCNVSIPSPDYPPILGEYPIGEKMKYPNWYIPASSWGDKIRKKLKKDYIPSKHPANPLGKWAIPIYQSVMLHCNANPKTNAKAISHGCFRVDEIDMEKIVSNVGKGTPIVILNNTIDIKEIKDKLFQVTI